MRSPRTPDLPPARGETSSPPTFLAREAKQRARNSRAGWERGAGGGRVHRGLRILVVLAALLAPPLWAEAAPDESTAAAPAVDLHPAASPHSDEPVGSVTGGAVTVEGARPLIPTSSTVATKLPLALIETPASVSVVPEALFDEQLARTVGDALENVSGVNVQPGQGAVFDFFTVRGFDSVSSALILTDGAPEPESTFYHLYNVDRVEVLKGPSAFLYGPGPLGGTLNLVRKQPRPGNGFFRIGAHAGSWDTVETRLDANVSTDDGTLSFRANAFGLDTEGYRDGRGGRSFAVFPSLAWRPGDRSALTVSWEHIDNDNDPDTGLPLVFDLRANALSQVPDVPRRRSYQSPLDLSEQEIDRFQGDFEHVLAGNLILRDKLYYRSFDWRSDTTALAGAFPSFGGGGPGPGLPVVVGFDVQRAFLTLDDEQEFLGNQLELLWEVETGSVTHELLFGLETARLADEFTFGTALLPAVDLFAPVEPVDSPDDVIDIGIPTRRSDATTDLTSPYVADQIRFGDRVQLLVGARFDIADFEEDVAGTRREDEELSPFAGLVVAPAPGLSLYANYGESFVPPSTFAQVQDQVPEESRQVEVGIKKSFLSGRGQVTVAGYDLERENLLIPDATGVLRQTGDLETRGAELELRLDPSTRWTLWASYAYTDSELTEFTERVTVPTPQGPVPRVLDRSGNDLAFVPEHLANVWVTRRLPAGVSVAGGVRWVDEQFIDEDNVFALDDYLTVDLAAFWDRGPWRLRLNLDNVTDEEYLTRGFNGTSVIPAPGFGATAGFDYRF